MLLEKLQSEMKQAMKDKATERLGVLRLIIADIKNEAFVKGNKRSEEDVVRAYHKKLVKAKEEFGDRDASFKQHLEFEIKVAEEFLPKLLSEDEIRLHLKELEASGTPIVLKTVMPLFKGKADPRIVQALIASWT